MMVEPFDYVEFNLHLGVALVSKDPYFLFAAHSLLGRERQIYRIIQVATLEELEQHCGEQNCRDIHVVICDLDSVAGSTAFYEELDVFVETHQNRNWLYLCIAGNQLEAAHEGLAHIPIHGFVAKNDIGYAMHLTVIAIAHFPVHLLLSRSSEGLRRRQIVQHQRNYRVIRKPQRHPAFSDQ